MTVIGYRFSLCSTVVAGCAVAVPLATWLALTAPSSLDPQGGACVAADACARPASERQSALELAVGARFMPSFHHGRFIGFMLFSMEPSSPFMRAGLRFGDTVASINGVAVTPHDLSQDGALARYAQALADNTPARCGGVVVAVDFLRAGQRGTLTHLLPLSP